MIEAIGNGFEAAFWTLGFGMGLAVMVAVVAGVVIIWEKFNE